MKLYSYGKINLFLNVIGKLENGYHSLNSIMQSIELHDEIFLEEIEEDEIKIECNYKSIPTDKRNTCYKAALLMKNTFNISKGVYIKLNKKLPSGAGLAGGSGNSAAVIKGLNEMWNLNLSEAQLLELGLKIGADVPFCLTGGTYMAEGIGEKLTKLEDFKWDNILIVKPSFNMSTAYVYNKLTPDKYNLFSQNKMHELIKEHKSNEAVNCTANTLEKVVEEIRPEIKKIKSIMYKYGAHTAMMTGSGSAVFGLFPDKFSMHKAFRILKYKYPRTYKTKTINTGIKIFNEQ